MASDRENPPVFDVGSITWWGLRKWKYYFELFFSIANPDGYNLFLTPHDYLQHQQKNPRLMAILLEIQKRARKEFKPDIQKKPRGGIQKGLKKVKRR